LLQIEAFIGPCLQQLEENMKAKTIIGLLTLASFGLGVLTASAAMPWFALMFGCVAGAFSEHWANL